METQTPLRLIVGLGNPGKSYESTRHNVGFWFLDALARQHGLSFKTVLQQADATKLPAPHACWLLRPNTFMNLSGQAVGAFARYHKIKPEEILIVHDELDIPVGTVRLKQDGGHGGHNGLRSLIQHLNSHAFKRLRMGIGRPHPNEDAADYVLKKPSSADKQQISTLIDTVIGWAPDLIQGLDAAFMNHFHTD